MSSKLLSWEEAVSWLRNQPDKQDFVRYFYYDDPVRAAAERFSGSEEWCALRSLIKKYLPGKVLDLGAGRGISSYAFAKEGCTVTALEPDASDLVGVGAIRQLFDGSGLSVEIVEESGESLPFENETFDIVYGRAVLHHAKDLWVLCREAQRVLKPGGIFVATREHVISSHEDLDDFLDKHLLHFLYGGENAYLLTEYQQAIASAGLKLKRSIPPLCSVINYSPGTKAGLSGIIEEKLSRRLGVPLGRWISKKQIVRWLYGLYIATKSDTPGRNYSFIAIKK